MGSNIVLTDDNQNVLARYEYDAFGAVCSEVGVTDNVRKFTGKEWEADVGLYYFAARYYDPYIGRFTQRDPAGDGLNWYAYAYNNPLKFVDPTGLRALSSLEASAVDFVFGGTVDPSELDIDIVVGLGYAKGGGWKKVRGFYRKNGQIEINADWYEAAGLSENSTLENTDILDHAVIDYLSIVIHEATHYWQQTYSLYTRNRFSPIGGVALYGFNFDQLLSLNLGREQHASSVAAYFVLSWQLDHGASEVRLDITAVTRLRFNGPPDRAGNPFGGPVHGVLGDTVNRAGAGTLLWFFNPLINQIRNPIPGPFRPTTLGDIK